MVLRWGRVYQNIRWRKLDNEGLNSKEFDNLVFGGIYLTLIAVTFILYFRQYKKSNGRFNKYVLPIFNIKKHRCISTALSIIYIFSIIGLSILILDYFMPFATLEDVEGLPDFVHTFDYAPRNSFDDYLIYSYFLYPFIFGHFIYLIIYLAVSYYKKRPIKEEN